ncbi:MAG: Na+/H+ antiporter subunit E [Corynebacterium sp.]|nr:Na+/H+ antiporter subunit E [Corynebacterium sp.]
MDYVTFPFRFVAFWAWYIKEFIVANSAVLKDIISRGHDSTPGVARYLCQSESEAHYTLIAALITVTPGTLVVGAGDTTQSGQRVMYVHGMYYDNADDLRVDLRDMEERMLRGTMIHPRFFEDRIRTEERELEF